MSGVAVEVWRGAGRLVFASFSASLSVGQSWGGDKECMVLNEVYVSRRFSVVFERLRRVSFVS